MSAQDFRALQAKGGGRKRSGFKLGPEHAFQVTVAEWLTLALPVGRAEIYWTSIDHAAAASALVGYWRKRRGVKGGIPDMQFVHRGRFITIELKAEDGDLSGDQRERRDEILRAGGHWHEARTLAQVAAILRHHRIPLFAEVPA